MVAISDRYKENSFVTETDTAIIVTSHPGHRMFLKATLENYMKTGKYVILSYDSHRQWPHEEVMNIPHTIITKPPTYGAEVRIGWLLDVILAGGIVRPLRNIETVIVTNGDCIWDIPENVDSLRAYMDRFEGDMMCVTADSVLHTAAMVMKGWVFQTLIDYLVCFVEENRPESYSPEILLRDFVEQRNIKNIVPKVQPKFPIGHQYSGKIDHYCSYNQFHTWNSLVGFRNLGGEHKAACYEHLEPLDKKYMDLYDSGVYFNTHERENLYTYYITKDRRWLWKYWTEGEESFFNRRYLPYNFYGFEPQWNDDNRLTHGPSTEMYGVFDRFKTGSYVLKDQEFEKKHKRFIEEKYPELLEGD